MTKSAIQTFYELLNKDNSLSTVDQIIQLKSELPELRIIALVEKIEDIAPFKNSVRWKPYACQIFQNYYDGVYNYKLDFIFNPNGSALLNLYVPEIERELSDKYIKEKLFKICEQNDISLETIETRKEYIIGSQFNNMKEIDDAIYKDIILLLNCLKIDSGLNL